jgi:hypothetical protein
MRPGAKQFSQPWEGLPEWSIPPTAAHGVASLLFAHHMQCLCVDLAVSCMSTVGANHSSQTWLSAKQSCQTRAVLPQWLITLTYYVLGGLCAYVCAWACSSATIIIRVPEPKNTRKVRAATNPALRAPFLYRFCHHVPFKTWGFVWRPSGTFTSLRMHER